MIVKVLVENTSISDNLGFEHGLCLYIETKEHKLLFDMGKSDLFIKNAEKMNVDLSIVDLAVVSHGHYDHGGGLKCFLEKNTKAPIYIHEKAFENHYSKRPNGIASIGLDTSLKDNKRIIFVGDYLKIDDKLELFSNISSKELISLSNKSLFMNDGEDLTEDTFSHEQNLIISEGGKTLLLAGCAHNGIINITNKFYDLKGKYPDYVIGGFHLFNPSTNKTEEPDLIKSIAERLKKNNTMYYTCHCTGIEAFELLFEVLDDKIKYLSTGSIVEL